MRSLLLAVLALSGTAALAAPPESARRLLQVLPGHWQGTLEYRDYQKPDRRVRLPTLVEGRATGTATLTLDYVYDDGPGKTVTDRDLLTLDEDHIQIGKEQYRYVGGQLAGDNSGTLVLEAESSDDDKPAHIRLTLRYTATTLDWLKETTSDGPDYVFRHRYVLQKNP